MSELETRLRRVAVPDATAARERSWRLVSTAYAEREPRSRRVAPRVALAVALAAAALAAGLTPAGATIGHWVRDVVAPADPQPMLGPLPGHGRLLALAPNGAWIVQADGTRRRLGAYEHATFSPHGLFVAVTRGRVLAAVDPRGRLRWTLTRPHPVSAPSWSPDGFRVAYRSGAEVRVVYGDGALDRRLARTSAAVTPAWQPAAAHRLAYADGRGRIVLRDTDSRRFVWRTAVAGAAQLAWSPSGGRLLVVSPDAVRVLDARGQIRRALRSPGTRAAAWVTGGRFVVLRSGEVLLAPSRRLLALSEPLTDLVAAPDGRHVLVAAPVAGQWLVVSTQGGRLTAFDSVARQFDPGGDHPDALPRPLAWIR
jgi:dipeptidyl aminopeptidase/acylaminoacyl peptidase